MAALLLSIISKVKDLIDRAVFIIKSFNRKPMKRIKSIILSIMLLAGTLLVPTESFSKDDQIIQGNCCPFYGQICMYGGPVVSDYLYSNGPDCPRHYINQE